MTLTSLRGMVIVVSGSVVALVLGGAGVVDGVLVGDGVMEGVLDGDGVQTIPALLATGSVHIGAVISVVKVTPG